MTPAQFKESRMLSMLTQEQAATILGKHVRTINRYEIGWTPVPSAVAYRLIDYLRKYLMKQKRLAKKAGPHTEPG